MEKGKKIELGGGSYRRPRTRKEKSANRLSSYKEPWKPARTRLAANGPRKSRVVQRQNRPLREARQRDVMRQKAGGRRVLKSAHQ